jgi:hypothetical protein
MQPRNEPIPSVPPFRPFLREKLRGTDGRGLNSPVLPSVPRNPERTENGRERTGTDGRGNLPAGAAAAGPGRNANHPQGAVILWGAAETGPLNPARRQKIVP